MNKCFVQDRKAKREQKWSDEAEVSQYNFLNECKKTSNIKSGVFILSSLSSSLLAADISRQDVFSCF